MWGMRGVRDGLQGFLVRSCYLQRLIGKKCRGGGENQELSFIDMVGLRCILDMPLELAVADKRPRLEIVVVLPSLSGYKSKALAGFSTGGDDDSVANSPTAHIVPHCACAR